MTGDRERQSFDPNLSFNESKYPFKINNGAAEFRHQKQKQGKTTGKAMGSDLTHSSKLKIR